MLTACLVVVCSWLCQGSGKPVTAELIHKLISEVVYDLSLRQAIEAYVGRIQVPQIALYANSTSFGLARHPDSLSGYIPRSSASRSRLACLLVAKDYNRLNIRYVNPRAGQRYQQP